MNQSIARALFTKQSVKREKQTRYLSQAIQLEEAVNPHIIRSTMSMVSLAIVTFIVWAGFTNINEVARTPGEVVPHGYQQTVQHFEGGIIKSIKVREGDVVKAGQVLLQLDGTSLDTDMIRAEQKQLTLDMQEERLRAFIADREPDFTRFKGVTSDQIADQYAFFSGMKAAREEEASVTREQLSQKEQAIATLQSELATSQQNSRITADIHAKQEKLHARGYSSTMSYLESSARMNQARGEINRIQHQIGVAESELLEFTDRLQSVHARHRDEALEKLDLVASEKAQNREIIQKVKERMDRLEIRSPAKGLVKGLAVNTVGAVVQPGQTLMEIVPIDEALEVQVKISPKDIGHLHEGLPVQVKFSTYDFSRYGSVQGRLKQISATTFTGENGERYYQGRIALDQAFVGHDKHNVVLPGMTVMADVITGEKTILQYLLKPIHLSLKSAFTER